MRKRIVVLLALLVVLSGRSVPVRAQGYAPPHTLQLQDEGVLQGQMTGINCTGAGITCSVSGGLAAFNDPGATIPTGTGFTHITGGAQDAAAKLVNLTASTDVAANQGTTTTLLHGNAGGQASFANVVSGDFGANILAVANGGTNQSAATDDNILVGDGTTWAKKALPNGAVSYTTSTNTVAQAGVSNLAASTSADLAGVLSDEAGTGKALFANGLLVVTGSNFTTTNTANQTITGLSWSGANGTNYWFECNLAATGTATGGPRISVTSSGASTTISYAITGHTTAATTQTYTGGSASGTQSASCTSSCLTTDIPFHVTGMIRPSASVTLAIAAANSTSGQTTTVKIGSSCLVLTP